MRVGRGFTPPEVRVALTNFLFRLSSGYHWSEVGMMDRSLSSQRCGFYFLPPLDNTAEANMALGAGSSFVLFPPDSGGRGCGQRLWETLRTGHVLFPDKYGTKTLKREPVSVPPASLLPQLGPDVYSRNRTHLSTGEESLFFPFFSSVHFR